MKSRTKNLLSHEDIQRLVKVNFGEEYEHKIGEIKELKGGMFNAIYLIQGVDEKNGIVLKVGVAPGRDLLTYEQDIMPTEVACYQLIKEKTSIPIPEILKYDFSKKYIDSNYFFMEELKGVPLSKASKLMNKPSLDKIKSKLAEYLVQLHKIEGNYFGYFTDEKKYQYDTWKNAFLSMFGQLLEDCKFHKVNIPYERIEQALKYNIQFLEEIKKPSLVMFDCHEGNVFVNKRNGEYEIQGIIDFERAFWGDPAADFPAAFIMSDDIRKEEAFLASYFEKSDTKKEYTRDDEIRFQMYRMYILTVMAGETFRYGPLYAKMQREWAKSGILKCLEILEE